MATMQINWRAGQSIIKKGTPIDVDGNIANNSYAVALVASDTVAPLDAEVITSGTFDEEKYYCGFAISDDCKRALSEINFIGTDGERHPATSLPTPKSDDAGKSAVVNERGNAYALGAGGGGLSLVSDGGINITWDGSTEGRDSFEAVGLTMYKVADVFLSADDLDRGEVTDGENVFTLYKEYFYVDDSNRFILAGEGAVASCRAGTYDLGGSVTVPSDGVYFATGGLEGHVFAVTSLIKSAPSKLMQNGEDVTQEVAETVGGGGSGGGMYVIHVTDGENGNYVVDKTYDEIREAYSNGLIPVCIMDSNSEIFYLFDADGRFAFSVTFCGGDEDTEELTEITHELVTISKIDGETVVKFYSYYHIFE